MNITINGPKIFKRGFRGYDIFLNKKYIGNAFDFYYVRNGIIEYGYDILIEIDGKKHNIVTSQNNSVKKIVKEFLSKL